LRGGAFNNNPLNVRSSNRNRNEPANRNNNIGFRPASTLRRACGFVRPESAGPNVPRSVPGCKVQAAALGRAVPDGPAEGSAWPGGSGRPQGSKAPPGRFVPGGDLAQHGNRYRHPFAHVGEFARLAEGRTPALTSPRRRSAPKRSPRPAAPPTRFRHGGKGNKRRQAQERRPIHLSLVDKIDLPKPTLATDGRRLSLAVCEKNGRFPTGGSIK